MKIQKFEDTKVWQDSRAFVKTTYQLTAKPKFKKDFSLRDQIQRAAVSIMNNIAEGYERDSNTEFIRFLLYSKGSSGEVRSLLYVALDLEYITEDEFNKHSETVSLISKQLANFIKYLRERNKTKRKSS